jgi:hypothetical protein
MRFERVFSVCSRLTLAMTVSACSGEAGAGPNRERVGSESALCDEIREGLLVAAQKDGIQALTNPDLVDPDSPTVDFLLPTDRVIGLEFDGEYIAVPHNILWWHEIVNFDDLGLTVTYCPLTGSSMIFHRTNVGDAEFAVSGLLFKNNLVMFDRKLEVDNENTDGETLWPQMLAGGFCGPLEGSELAMYPAIEIEWEDWLALHPDTRVVGERTGLAMNYQIYPYGFYEQLNNRQTLDLVLDPDERRPPKERILGIRPTFGQAVAFPFGALRDVAVGGLTVVHADLGGEFGETNVDPIVVFWDSEAAAAVAFHPSTFTRDLNFEVRNGAFMDVETGSQWSIDGRAISGPLEGERLRPRQKAYVSFWFAFSQLFPDPVLWLP